MSSQRSPFELSTAEAQSLLRQIAGFGGDPLPQLVITGGDPLQRPDLFELIAYARGLGLSVSITPAGTAALTRTVITHLKEAGLGSIALSLDGSTPAVHDTFLPRASSSSTGWARSPVTQPSP